MKSILLLLIIFSVSSCQKEDISKEALYTSDQIQSKFSDNTTYDVDGNILFLGEDGNVYISYLNPDGTYSEPIIDNIENNKTHKVELINILNNLDRRSDKLYENNKNDITNSFTQGRGCISSANTNGYTTGIGINPMTGNHAYFATSHATGLTYYGQDHSDLYFSLTGWCSFVTIDVGRNNNDCWVEVDCEDSQQTGCGYYANCDD